MSDALTKEAEAAFKRLTHPDSSFTNSAYFIVAYKAAAESRDQRIRRLVAGQHAMAVALIAALDVLRPGDD